jgi:hypothetical protein
MSHNGQLHKFIEGACIEGEWEHLIGAIGMIINESTYKAQFQGGNVLFSTAFADYGTCARVIWTVILTEHSSIGSSPPVNRGSRCVSVQNPFSSGPGGMGMGGTTLACHGPGMYCYISVSQSYFQCVSSSHLRARKSAGFYETVSDVKKLNCIKRKVPPGSRVIVAYTLNT